MITMREAAKIYNKHYYGGKGEQTLKRLNDRLEYTPEEHDSFHLAAIGGGNMKGDINYNFDYLDKNGFVARNAGIKAELLQFMYQFPFVQRDTIETYLSDTLFPNIFKYIHEFKNKGEDTKYSHIPELHELIASYKKIENLDKCKVIDFLDLEEFAFHWRKSQELHAKIAHNHPECIDANGHYIPSKILDLDVKEFCIDNFTEVEKLKLPSRGQGLSK